MFAWCQGGTQQYSRRQLYGIVQILIKKNLEHVVQNETD